MPQGIDIGALRRHAVARSLFTPTTLLKAVEKLGGFVQADPLRAPARAQDLTLRHRVKGYQAGDLERRYPRLPLQEDFFINYGFVTPELRARPAVSGTSRAGSWPMPCWPRSSAWARPTRPTSTRPSTTAR
jgi:hypothetical protein